MFAREQNRYGTFARPIPGHEYNTILSYSDTMYIIIIIIDIIL